MKTIIIAGGTGFIGQFIANRYRQNGCHVTIITRNPNASSPYKLIGWNDDEIKEACNGADLVLNLAGKSVDCRYTDKNKTLIFDSRILTTRQLGKCIEECEIPPKLWINSSTATIYRHTLDQPMTETNGELGRGFSVGIARAWEDEFYSFDLPETRQIALRTAIVLGEGGGVINPYTNMVRFGFGGPQGSGNQMISWIHIMDLFRIVQYLEQSEFLEGTFNCASPNPITNKEFMRVFRHVMNKKMKLPIPESLLKFGAKLIRTEPELILKSRYVIPEKLQQYGFEFTFPYLIEALEHILHRQEDNNALFHLNT